jgi:hypothetical protein
MPNINYSLGKDYLTFSGVDSGVIYYIQSWDGLGLTTEDATTSSFYGPIYNPGGTLIYNTLSVMFAMDEEWRVFENITKMVIQNTVFDNSSSQPILTDITLHLMSNTYQKEVAQILMHDGYIQSIQNVQNIYNTDDNTRTKTLQAIIKYQYHEFIRLEDA